MPVHTQVEIEAEIGDVGLLAMTVPNRFPDHLPPRM